LIFPIPPLMGIFLIVFGSGMILSVFGKFLFQKKPQLLHSKPFWLQAAVVEEGPTLATTLGQAAVVVEAGLRQGWLLG
jgi:hypothetical protein